MKKNMIAALAGIGVSILTLTGCQSGNMQGGSAAQTPVNETADAVQETGEPAQTDAAEEGGMEPAGVPETTEAKPAADVESVEYSYEDLYLSAAIPDGWGYRIKTAQEMAKEDGLVSCAITFWSQEYPAAVFSLEYMQSFGMCGTGVTIEEFTLANGLSGYRYTEEIEGTLWLTITLSNPVNGMPGNTIQEGTYCIEASPDLAAWDAVKPEFEEILETVWVGPRSGGAGAADAQIDTQSQGASQAQPDTQSQGAAQAQPDTQSQSMAQPQTGTQSGVTLEQAKSIALADAGLLASDVTFIKEELDYDHGVAEYEIEFVTSTTQYEYEIKADDGAVAKAQQKPIEKINEKAQTQAQGGITLEEAKAAALEHAGVTESQVVFSKLELDYDDGIAEYEIEFYVGKKEYSYEIDASTGKILEAEVDWD